MRITSGDMMLPARPFRDHDRPGLARPSTDRSVATRPSRRKPAIGLVCGLAVGTLVAVSMPIVLSLVLLVVSITVLVTLRDQWLRGGSTP